MFCQECGTQLRARAKFCNKCGTPVQQRFSEEDVITPPLPPTVSQPAPLPKPALPKAKTPVSHPSQSAVADKRIAQLDTTKSTTTTRSHQTSLPYETATSTHYRWQREAELKPFFTKIAPALPNRHHNRLIMIVPLLLAVVILIFLFAYIAAR